jgi:predicted membrane protein
MLGSTLVVIAFYLLQLEKVASNSLTYNLMNLCGAVFLLISLSVTFNLASFVIEVFWIGASLIGLWKIFRHRNSKRHPEERFG